MTPSANFTNFISIFQVVLSVIVGSVYVPVGMVALELALAGVGAVVPPVGGGVVTAELLQPESISRHIIRDNKAIKYLRIS
jgi:hypothetical protein